MDTLAVFYALKTSIDPEEISRLVKRYAESIPGAVGAEDDLAFPFGVLCTLLAEQNQKVWDLKNE